MTERNENNTKTPDYLWRDKLWDLKNASSIKAINSALRKGLKQIRENPGGIIIDFGELAFELPEALKTIEKRMQWNTDIKLDIMLISKNDTKAILRYQ